MKIFIYINLIFIADTAKTRYNSFQSNGQQKVCYIKEILANNSHSLNQLDVDKKNNILFFGINTGQGEFTPALLDIDTKQLKLLKGVKDAFAVANDEKAGLTYFGGSQGIYKYLHKEKKLFRLAISNLDVWWLVIKKNIYFIQFPSLTAYVYKDRTIKLITQLKKTIVHQFVFDFDENMYFVNGSGLFGIKNGSYEHVLLRSRPAFFSMAVDNTGQVYVSSEDGIYVVSKLARKVKPIFSVPNVQAITFDRNNHLIYSDSNGLVRLIAVTTDQYYKNLYKSGHSTNVNLCI